MQQKFFLGLSQLGFHRVAYTEWGVAIRHPPVICVHGLTRNGRDFDHLAETLSKGAQILCPDIAGRGQSDWLKDPALYSYPQYLSDMTALIARSGMDKVDWIGTSMGGIIGMLLAAQPGTPIRRLVINDVGPFISAAGLKRIAEYVGQQPEFNDAQEAEKYLRVIYSGFGIRRDEDWRQLTSHSLRALPNGKLTLAYDPAIAQSFIGVHQDVDFWNLYDKISCPTLLLRGQNSDILPADVAQQMTQRGPKAKLIEFPAVGHAPALMDTHQIMIIRDFLEA